MEYKPAVLNYKSNDPLSVSISIDFTTQLSTKSFLKIAKFVYRSSHNSLLEVRETLNLRLETVTSSFIFVIPIILLNIT